MEPMPEEKAGLKELIDSKLNDAGISVTNMVVDGLVAEENKMRAEAVTTCYKKLQVARGELGKASRPDSPTAYDGEGKPLPGTFTKAGLDARTKASDNVTRLELAIEKALIGDFSKVKELAKQGGGNDHQNGKKESEKDSPVKT